MLGTSYGSCEMLKKAKLNGAYTIVTDPREPSESKGKLIADEYWMINTTDIDSLEKKCIEEKVSGVVCGVSETNLESTMELTRRLGLPCYCTPEAWHYSRNKYDFKQLCKEANVRMAEDYHMSNPPTEEELNAVKFPVVVKAIDLSANRGMSYCYNKDELVTACEYARSKSKSDVIIVERMLKGVEVSADYFMSDGEVRLLSVNNMINQPGELQNCYSITTTENKHVRRFIREENDDIVRVLKKVGCREGFGWVETILDEDGHFYLLEMGYRLCGNIIYDPLAKLSGLDALELIIDYALGIKHKPSELPEAQNDYYDGCGCVYCLWSNQSGIISSINGVDEVLKDAEIRWDGTYQVGDNIGAHTIICAFMFVTSCVEDMCRKIELINEKVIINNEKGENMYIHYTDFDYLRNNSRDFAE